MTTKRDELRQRLQWRNAITKGIWTDLTKTRQTTDNKGVLYRVTHVPNVGSDPRCHNGHI